MINNMKHKLLKYDALFEEQKEGGYTVTVPSLPGCISEGDTLKESKANIKEAIQLYLEDLALDGEKIPSDKKSVFINQIKVNLDMTMALS